MADKALKISLVLFMVALGVFIISGAFAQIKNDDPEINKLRQLILDYRNKKAQGCDTSEIEGTFRSLMGAKERGEWNRFTQLLKRLETQLRKVKPPPEKPAKGATLLDKSPWPMYCHDPQHTCRSPYKGLTYKPVKQKWTFTSPGGHGICSPAAIGSDGTLYVGTWKNKHFARDKMKGHSGVLYALMPNGSLIWQHDSNRGSLLASAIESAPLLTSDGKIIYGKDDGHVYALNSKGELLWDFSCDDIFDPEKPFDDNEQVIPSPVLGPDGTLYICSHWGNVYNPMVMRELAKRIPSIKKFGIKPSKKPLWSKVYAIDIKTGSRKWVYDPSLDFFPVKRVIWGSPAVGDDGIIYFGAYDKWNKGYLYALYPNGTKKWRFSKNDGRKIDALQSSPSIGRDGTIYIGSFGGKNKAKLYAINPDGSLKWSYEILENRITSPPGIGPDGTIYVGSHNWGFFFNRNMSKRGHLYALKDQGHKPKLKWKFDVEYGIGAPLAIDSQGSVFFGTNCDPFICGRLGDYHIYALNHKGEKLWKYPLKGRVFSSPVIDNDGTVYVGTTQSDAKLYALGTQSK